MSVIICDASPLIFLAKLNRLNLIAELLDGDISVLKCVVDEASSENATPQESARLEAFLDRAEIIDFETSKLPSASLSRSDQSTLTWAIDNHTDWLVADERLLRRIAIDEGLSVVGFLGILVEAARKGLLSTSESKQAINNAVSLHDCRISIALYQRLLAELDTIPPA